METRAILKSFLLLEKQLTYLLLEMRDSWSAFKKKPKTKNKTTHTYTQNKINKQINPTSQTNIPVHIYLMEYISKKQFGSFGRRIFEKKIWYLGEMDTRLMVFFYDDNTLGRLFAMKIILRTFLRTKVE